VDGISDGQDLLIGAIIEHVENAGVHSGDATMSIPPQTLPVNISRTIEDFTHKIVEALQIIGPFNIQFLVKDGIIHVIECNLRASRSMPYVCKTRGVNLIELATLAMLGKKFRDFGIIQLPPVSHVAVKAPQFSFMRLSGADPVLGVEMLSTGEVACLGENFADALLKALQSAEFKVPPGGGSVLVTVGGEELKRKVVPLAKALRKMGFRIWATEHTAEALHKAGLKDVTVIHKVKEVDKNPNILEYIRRGKIDLVINIPVAKAMENYTDLLEDEYVIRRLAVEFNIPVVTNLELASALVKVLMQGNNSGFSIRSLNEYMDSLIWKFW
jgi:carbamoyl-phosphate synthase large subunit